MKMHKNKAPSPMIFDSDLQPKPIILHLNNIEENQMKGKLLRYFIFLFVTLFFHFCLLSGPLAADTGEKTVINKKEKAQIIETVNQQIVEKYIFPDIAEQIKKYIAGKLKNGDYKKLKTAADFAHQLEQDLRRVSNDRHFRIEFNPEAAKDITKTNSQTDEERAAVEEKLEREDGKINFGFKTVKILPGNIGYLDLRYFGKYVLRPALETAVHAMNFLSNSDAIIIDLRRNGGGRPKVIQFLCSYFVKPGVHLNTLYYRYKNLKEQFWTLPYVPGKRMVDKDLYILTSGWTFSGGEEFAYNLKNLKRATLIGEKTRGGAHDEKQVSIGDQFVLQIPVGRAFNPVTNTNWEGVGVEPDIKIAEKDALDKAQLMILNKLKDSETEKTARAAIDFAIGEIRVRLMPVSVNEEILRKYTGEFYSRKIRLEKGVFYMHRKGINYKLTPISDILFSVEGVDDHQISFDLNPDGTPKALVLVWDDGFRSIITRSK